MTKDILLAALFGLAVPLLMIIRNYLVFKLRSSMCTFIFSCSIDDYQWRLDYMDTVSYDQMFWQFWKPVEAKFFYQNLRFIQKEWTT